MLVKKTRNTFFPTKPAFITVRFNRSFYKFKDLLRGFRNLTDLLNSMALTYFRGFNKGFGTF